MLLGAILNNHYEVENVSGTICPNFWNVVNKHRMLHKEIKGRILGHQPTDSHRSSNKDLFLRDIIAITLNSHWSDSSTSIMDATFPHR